MAVTEEAVKKLLGIQRGFVKSEDKDQLPPSFGTERAGDYGMEVMGFGSIWQRVLVSMSVTKRQARPHKKSHGRD